jgi:hypothetical protein
MIREIMFHITQNTYPTVSIFSENDIEPGTATVGLFISPHSIAFYADYGWGPTRTLLSWTNTHKEHDGAFGYENSIGCTPLGERAWAPSVLNQEYSKDEYDDLVNLSLDDYKRDVAKARENATSVQVLTMPHKKFLEASNTLVENTSRRLSLNPTPKDIKALFTWPRSLGRKGFLPEELAQAFQFDIAGNKYKQACAIF